MFRSLYIPDNARRDNNSHWFAICRCHSTKSPPPPVEKSPGEKYTYHYRVSRPCKCLIHGRTRTRLNWACPVTWVSLDALHTSAVYVYAAAILPLFWTVNSLIIRRSSDWRLELTQNLIISNVLCNTYECIQELTDAAQTLRFQSPGGKTLLCENVTAAILEMWRQIENPTLNRCVFTWGTNNPNFIPIPLETTKPFKVFLE